jgi:two-component system chemotaxis response regulator CheY
MMAAYEHPGGVLTRWLMSLRYRKERFLVSAGEYFAQRKVRGTASAAQQQGRRIADQPADGNLARAIAMRRAARGGLSIMVVEEDFFTRSLALSALGNNVFTMSVSSALEGLSKYPNAAPDVVFLDVSLVGAGDHDMLARLLRMDPGAYVVMVGGSVSSEEVTRLVSAGAAGFILKPFTKDKLRQYVEKCPRWRGAGRGGVISL